MAASDILKEMIDKAPDQVENIANSISQVQSQIDDLTTQIDAIQTGMCDVAETDLTTYMNDTKIPALEALYGGDTPYMFAEGGNYGSIDYTTGGITDWEVLDDLGVLVYKYGGLNWDSDTTITKLITDFDFARDYLSRPMTTGATYGLIPARANLNTAKGILNSNKSKIQDSITSLADYAS